MDPHARPLWGTETQLAIDNFPISGQPMPWSLIRWLSLLKRAAAVVNAELGVLDRAITDRIVAAADAIVSGNLVDQFPVDVYQTGSGTSTNMNVNEVISALTDGVAHPNDHVNRGQSSNDLVPTAAQLAACELVEHDLLPAVDNLAARFRERATAFADIVKPGRTHLMDAVPVLLGDELASYAAQLDEAREGITAALVPLGRVPLGGTAVGNGLGSHPEFADRVLALIAADANLATELTSPPERIARQGSHDALVGMSGALAVLAVALTKICNDIRWMASGPNTGLGDIDLPDLQKGSSIMPGKVNPVIPEAVLQVAARVIGNHTTMTVAGMQGNLELNVMIPVMATTLIESIELLASSINLLADRCIAGIGARADRSREMAGRSPAIATALNAELGYEAVEAIVKESMRTDRTIRAVARDHGVADELLDRLLDLDRIARGRS